VARQASPGRGPAGRGPLAREVDGFMSGRMVGWAVGRRGKGAVSSSLAALMAVLIIAVAAVTFLALTGYFTSIAARSGDIERMMMKSREVVKLAIGYDVVREDGQVRFPVRMQLKNAWSGTSEITYVVVLDRQGNVLYEKSLDPPLTLYASETRFMRPSQLVPELAPYDGDWYRMRREIGLIILHTRLGNRFTSFYEAPGGPVLAYSVPPAVTITELHRTTTTVYQTVTSIEGVAATRTLTNWVTAPTTVTVTRYETNPAYFTITAYETRRVWGPAEVTVTVTIPDQVVTVTSTRTVYVTNTAPAATRTVTSTNIIYVTVPVTSTNVITSTITRTSETTATQKTTKEITTIVPAWFDPIIGLGAGIVNILKTGIVIPALVLLGMPDRFYRRIMRSWRIIALALIISAIASIYLAGVGMIGIRAETVTVSITPTTVTITKTETITSISTITSKSTVTTTTLTTITTSTYTPTTTKVYIISPTYTTHTIPVTTCGWYGGPLDRQYSCIILGWTRSVETNYVTRPQVTVTTTIRETMQQPGGVSTVTQYVGGKIITSTAYITVTSTIYQAPSTVTVTAYTTVTSTRTGGSTITVTSTSWKDTMVTITYTTTVTYYSCKVFIGIDSCGIFIAP